MVAGAFRLTTRRRAGTGDLVDTTASSPREARPGAPHGPRRPGRRGLSAGIALALVYPLVWRGRAMDESGSMVPRQAATKGQI